MRYRELDVPPALRPFVRAVWHLAGASEPAAAVEAAEPIVPDGCLELVVNFGDPVDEHLAPGRVRRQPAVMLTGVVDAPTVVTPSGAIDFWGVRLQPWAARAFLGAPASLLRRETMPLAEVTGAFARTLADAGDRATDEGRRVAILDALAERARCVRAPSAATIALASRALESAEPLGVRELARGAGLGTRRVQAIFAEEVGAGPKLLMRLGRFQRALALARETRASWGRIAAMAGYYDQAHLVRDARQFAGRAPSELFPGRESLTEVFAGAR